MLRCFYANVGSKLFQVEQKNEACNKNKSVSGVTVDIVTLSESGDAN